PLQLLLVAILDGSLVGKHHPVDLLLGERSIGLGRARGHGDLDLVLLAHAQGRPSATVAVSTAGIELAGAENMSHSGAAAALAGAFGRKPACTATDDEARPGQAVD